MPGVPPAERKCEALVTKDPITKVAVNEVPKQFADIPGADTSRPPEKGVWVQPTLPRTSKWSPNHRSILNQRVVTTKNQSKASVKQSSQRKLLIK